MAAQRLLIAGCGALGLELARLAATEGSACFGLRRHPPGPVAGLTWIAGDVLAPAESALPADLTGLVYAVSPGGRELARYRAAYVDGLTALLAALQRRAGRLPRCLLVTSTAVWGASDGGWVEDSTPVSPADDFAQQLVLGERTLARLAPDSASVRAGGLYGPGRSYAIERARANQALAPGAAQRFTNRIHLHDAARALLLLLKTPTLEPSYALVDQHPASELELMTFLAHELGLGAPVVQPEGGTTYDPPGRSGNKRVRPSRLAALGFEWRYPSYKEGYRAILQGPPKAPLA